MRGEGTGGGTSWISLKSGHFLEVYIKPKKKKKKKSNFAFYSNKAHIWLKRFKEL